MSNFPAVALNARHCWICNSFVSQPGKPLVLTIWAIALPCFLSFVPSIHPSKMLPDSEQSWPVHDRFLELRSRWMTLIGEHLQDHQGNLLEYWRIEKADSVIVLPIQAVGMGSPPEHHFLLPAPSYRPGVGQCTLDFPGGRVPEGEDPEAAAIATLKRELGIEASSIAQLMPLNAKPWAVNSSFSNQQLYGFVAHIERTANLASHAPPLTYPVTSTGIRQLLQDLSCLQCRAVLLEWMRLQPVLSHGIP